MRNLWFIFIGMILAFIVFFNFNFDKPTTQKRQDTVPTKIAKNPKNSNSIVTRKAPVSIKENIQVTTQPEDEQIYQEEISKLYPEGKKIQSIPKSTIIKNTLTIKGASKVKIKIKAKEKDGIVKAKVSISHEMLTYAQAKKKELKVNFITHIMGLVGGRVVYDASTSQFLSKNPLLKFSFRGKKGEVLTIIYQDLKGERFYDSKKIR